MGRAEVLCRSAALALVAALVRVEGACARVALGLALGYVACLLAQNFRRRGEPPVAWSWTPFLGSAIVFGKRPREWLLARRAELGDTFVAVIAGERTAFVVDADAWPKVLREPASRLEFRSTGMDVTEAAFGVQRADVADAFADAVDAQAHAQFVRCLQGREPLARLTAAAAAALEAGLADIPAEAPLFASLAEPLFLATMAALTGADSSFATAACHADFKAFDAAFGFLAGGAPAAAFGAAVAARDRVADRYRTDANYDAADGRVCDLLRERKALFGECEAESDRSWDPRSHGRIQTTMVWAAAANTIPAALWTAYWLARDAKARARVVAEIDAAGPDVAAALRRSENPYPVLDAAVSEALRLATASLTVRRVVVDGYALPASDLKLRRRDRVAIFPPLLHMDAARVGAAPDAFNVDRYLDDPDTPLMPFGGGISKCPGRIFARREIKACLAVLLRRYDVRLVDAAAPVPESDPTRVGLGVVGPKPGVDVAAAFTPRAA